MKGEQFEIQRVDSSGQIKSLYADTAESAYKLYSIVGVVEAKPKIIHKNKEISYIKFIEILQRERRNNTQNKNKLIQLEKDQLQLENHNDSRTKHITMRRNTK
jgi:hypothetical protein